MAVRFAQRMGEMKASEIREILKLTQRPEVISFAGGLPAPECFPVEELAAVTARVLSESGRQALQYSTTEGYPPLRRWIADHMNDNLGTSVGPDDVLVTSGSQQGLDLTGKIFVNEGDVVLCESPTYLGAINALRAYRPRFVEVPTDDDGLIPEALEAILDRESRASLLYVVPDFQNPTGRTWSLSRRHAVLDVPAPPGAGDRGRPVLRGALRGRAVAGAQVPRPRRPRRLPRDVLQDPLPGAAYRLGRRVRGVAREVRPLQAGCRPPDRHARADAGRRTRRIVRSGRERRPRLCHLPRAARRDDPGSRARDARPASASRGPPAGCSCGPSCRRRWTPASCSSACLERHVAFVPGGSFFPNGGHENTMRLNFSNMPADRIEEGVRRLGAVLREFLARGEAGSTRCCEAAVAG